VKRIPKSTLAGGRVFDREGPLSQYKGYRKLVFRAYAFVCGKTGSFVCTLERDRA
jgi:hypothetical protein